MRTRTEEKRREIVTAAAELFVELGYERTSMSAISARVGGSKATLYSYFESKEDLLRAVLADSVEEESDRLMQEFPADADLREGLIRLGIQYLTGRLAPLPIAIMCILATQPQESALGTEFYASVLKPAWKRFAGRIAVLMDEGRLVQADPWIAAMHWKGLNEGELLEKRLFGVTRHPESAEIATVATAAADAFIKLYAIPT